MDKILCFGKNYLEHARELGDAVPEQPVIFLKPPSVLLPCLSPQKKLSARLPSQKWGEVHHEVEAVLRLRSGGFGLSPTEALGCIGELSVGLDMTLRGLQTKLKKSGHPWEVAKVFPGSAIVGPWVKALDFPSYLSSSFTLHVNGRLRQQGSLEQMTFSLGQLLSLASHHFPLCADDLVFTGTPAGIGPIVPGDCAELHWGSIQYQVEWEKSPEL